MSFDDHSSASYDASQLFTIARQLGDQLFKLIFVFFIFAFSCLRPCLFKFLLTKKLAFIKGHMFFEHVVGTLKGLWVLPDVGGLINGYYVITIF